jgi:hypothetical protein
MNTLRRLAIVLLIFAGGSPAANASVGSAPKPLTPAEILRFLIKTEDDVRWFRHLLEQSRKPAERRVLGTCFGGRQAWYLAKREEVLRGLGAWVTGPAVQCYVATYFGCSIGDDIGIAGLAMPGGPLREPWDGSKVTIIEQTRDRIVAEVTESSEPDGDPADTAHHSRFTLVRDAAGTWRIWDRQVTQEWECRPR